MKNKKIVFTGEWKVEIGFDEIDAKGVNEEEILVKNHYSLISAGTELACLAGKEAAWFKFPSTPGYTSVGEVIACGEKVDGFKPGDVVFCYGPHSQYIKLHAGNDFCVKVTEGLDQRFAVFTRIATIAMTAIRTSEIELGDFVGVTGLGVVGNMAAQLAKAQGGFVIGLDVDKSRLETALKCGIKHVLDSGDSGLKEKMEEATGGKGVGTLIEATGLAQVAVNSLPFIARGGELILLGTPRDEFFTDATGLLREFHLAKRALKLKPAHEWIYPVKQDAFVKHSFERNTSIVFELIKSGSLKVEPLLSHIIKPEEAAAAYAAFRKREEGYNGVVIDWN